MVSKPSTLPKWAENDVVDNVSGENNVIEPPAEKKNIGWSRLEYPPRNWFNWLGRFTYRWLNWLKQQEEQAVVTNGDGVGLFPTDGALITFYAVDIVDPTHYLVATGYKASATNPVLTVTSSDTLTLDTGNFTVTGNAPITTATISSSDPDNCIIWGQSKIIP